MKALLNSDVARKNIGLLGALGEVQDVQFKQINWSVINLAYFDFLENLNIVTPDAKIMGDYDEWVEGMQLSDKLRKAMMFEDDENYTELHQDKY